MITYEINHLHLFCGLGGGAKGFRTKELKEKAVGAV